MSFNLTAEVKHAEALDKEQKKIISVLKEIGYKFNGNYDTNKLEFEREKGLFVIDLSLS